MKHVLILVLSLSLALILVGPGCARRTPVYPALYPPNQAMVMDIGIFYDELSPYGQWIQLDMYGWVWTPFGVTIGWRPYTNGYWVYTDSGWVWYSRWRWGWATFHYGRWFFHHHHGWVWVPGTVWGPGWVIWKHQPGWVGWAPLPPQATWHPGRGLHADWSEIDQVVEPHWYSFVEERYLGDQNLDKRIDLTSRNITHLRECRNVTSYLEVNNKIYNQGVQVELIEQATGRRQPRYQIVDSHSRVQDHAINGTELRLYRPKINDKVPEKTPSLVPVPSKQVESSSDLIRRQEAERLQLEKQQKLELKELEKQRRKDQPKPPGTAPAQPTKQTQLEDLNNRHKAEKQSRDDQVQRERQLLKRQPAATRRAEPSKPKPTPKPNQPAQPSKRKPAGQ